MRMLDLFSGIGGFALAAEWAWEEELDIVGFCEIDSYSQRVLRKNFPGVPIHEDISKLNGKKFKQIDLITGGFPCQDISVANPKAKGIEGERSGLWFEMLRVIREVRPRYALIENVPMLTVRGGTRVISDLTKIGYDASWTIISAKDVGAWHKRARIWIVATDSKNIRCGRGNPKGCSDERWEVFKSQQRRSEMGSKTTGCSTSHGDISDTKSKRQSPFKNRTTIIRPQERSELLCGSGNAKRIRPNGEYWATEPKLGRVANGIHNRVDRLKGLGNAIVPQVAYEIFKRIRSLELGIEKE